MTDIAPAGTVVPLTESTPPNDIALHVQAFLLRHSPRADDGAALNPGDDVFGPLFRDRPNGRIAYSLTGEGPLVIFIPGIGEVRAACRFLGASLADTGFQVAAMDSRGHGDSDASLESYDDIAAGTDLIALAKHLGAAAIVIGHSMGAAAACWMAAEAQALTTGLVLLGPFVRERPANLLGTLMFRMAPLRSWSFCGESGRPLSE